jgi:hypothetical protein
MDNNKIAAAMLTLTLWNSRVKSTKEQAGDEDWKLVVADYINILSELTRRGTP